jgi:hypothetical protein
MYSSLCTMCAYVDQHRLKLRVLKFMCMLIVDVHSPTTKGQPSTDS